MGCCSEGTLWSVLKSSVEEASPPPPTPGGAMDLFLLKKGAKGAKDPENALAVRGSPWAPSQNIGKHIK